MAKSVIGDLIQIFRSSVSAVLPENMIRNTLTYNAGSQQLTISGDVYNLQNKNVYVVGTGKAVQNMAREVDSLLNSKIKYGIISIPEGSLDKNTTMGNVKYFEGARNNLPDVNAVKTAVKIKDLALKLDSKDLLLVLISGGGSALLPLPKDPIKLEEKTDLIKKLANSGADIKELNTVRKRLSDLKGGQLAIKAQPAQVVSLILSDIVGDPLDLIASGPTVANEDDISKAINIINKYSLFDDLPESIKTVLNKNSDDLFPEDNVRNYIIGSNKISIEAASYKCQKLDYIPIVLSNTITGNVKDVAKTYAELVKLFVNYLKGNFNVNQLKVKLDTINIPDMAADDVNKINDTSKDICLILGGEITVEVNGSGKGGRNQQLALEFSDLIHKMKKDMKNFDVYLLSAGTDGIDGPTDAAGAIGYLNLITESEASNVDVNSFLKNNDTYNFYKTFKNGSLHVITGHTNTNVMDIHLIIIKRC
ncbi:glycerate kinase [Manduca sexta]|uniref:glycerate kinase n=1 Tax=Manduca sexta TaxID=7130 RepID=UPI001182D10D|nr:glycerate kinase [Manduca sexta]